MRLVAAHLQSWNLGGVRAASSIPSSAPAAARRRDAPTFQDIAGERRRRAHGVHAGGGSRPFKDGALTTT